MNATTRISGRIDQIYLEFSGRTATSQRVSAARTMPIIQRAAARELAAATLTNWGGRKEENWVWKGAETVACLQHCLVNLSR